MRINGAEEMSELISLDNATKVLDLNIGRNTLFRILREKGILMVAPGRRNVPYQKYVNSGYFRVIQQKFFKKDIRNNYYKTVLTDKGLEFILRIVGESCQKSKR